MAFHPFWLRNVVCGVLFHRLSSFAQLIHLNFSLVGATEEIILTWVRFMTVSKNCGIQTGAQWARFTSPHTSHRRTPSHLIRVVFHELSRTLKLFWALNFSASPERWFIWLLVFVQLAWQISTMSNMVSMSAMFPPPSCCHFKMYLNGHIHYTGGSYQFDVDPIWAFVAEVIVVSKSLALLII